MSDPGSSSGSSTTSNAGNSSRGDNHPPSKKRKPEQGSSSDPIQWLYENLADLVDDEYSQQDWSRAVIDRLRTQPRTGPNLVKIMRTALGALQSLVVKKGKECALLKSKIDSLETKLAKQTAVRDAPGKAAAAKAAHDLAAENVKNEALLLKLDNVAFVKPFGKYDLALYSSLIVLSSKKGDQQLRILLDDIDHVLRVVSPTSKDEVVVLPLGNAVTVGKTTHDAIALKFKSKDTVAVSVPPSAAQITLRGSTAADLAALCAASANASQNVAGLFSRITGKPVDMENESVFRSMSASRTCIICHYKASHGILWPLKSGLLFGLKPLIWIAAADVVKVDVVRSSRYFELVVTVYGQTAFHFEMIEMDEESALSRYGALQKFGQRGGKHEALYNKEEMPTALRYTKDVADDGIDESSDDSDFVMETSSGSSIPEDYDSEVEETDDDDDDGNGGSEHDDDDDSDTDQNSAAAAGAGENGLDAFAVVSGSSDSDT